MSIDMRMCVASGYRASMHSTHCDGDKSRSQWLYLVGVAAAAVIHVEVASFCGMESATQWLQRYYFCAYARLFLVQQAYLIYLLGITDDYSC